MIDVPPKHELFKISSESLLMQLLSLKLKCEHVTLHTCSDGLNSKLRCLAACLNSVSSFADLGRCIALGFSCRFIRQHGCHPGSCAFQS